MRSLLTHFGPWAGVLALLLTCCGPHRGPTQGTTLAPAYASIVELRTTAMVDGTELEDGTGSGVVVDRHGFILSCCHVVSGAASTVVAIGDERFPAEVVATDAILDLALLHVDHEFTREVDWGDNQTVTAGDPVFAIGYPFDLTKVVRQGCLSSLSLLIHGMPYLVTDAAINPGDSGGGLFTAQGQLIGISARIYVAQGLSANVGIGFAIPGNTAHWFVIHNLPSLTKGASHEDSH